MASRLFRNPWLWVAVGLGYQTLALVLYVRSALEGDATRLYMVTPRYDRETILHEAYPPGAIGHTVQPYDCFYFLALANDPSLRYHASHADRSGWVFYRGRRILWPWVAWATAWGDPRRIIYTLPITQLALLGLGQWAVARMLIAHGRHPAWSLLHAASLGATICIVRPLADLFAVNLMLVGMGAIERRRDGLAAIGLALACLTRETTILIVMVVAVYDLAHRRWRAAAWYAIPPLIMAAWWAAIALRVPAITIDAHNVGLPLAGLAGRLTEPPLAKGMVDALALGVTAFCVASVFLARLRDWDLWRLILLPLAVLAICSTRVIWFDYWSYGRVHMAIPAILLWCFAARGRRLDLAGPVASALAGSLVWATHLGFPRLIGQIARSLGAGG